MNTETQHAAIWIQSTMAMFEEEIDLAMTPAFASLQGISPTCAFWWACAVRFFKVSK